MEAVKVWNEERGCEHEEEEVSKKDITAPEWKFDDLHDKLSSRLRHSMGTESTSIPLASPPSTIGFIMLELTWKEYRDEEFEDGALNVDDSNQTKYRMRSIPELQEPLQMI